MWLINALKCRCGTVIKSKHRHDFVKHGDVAVDGGHEYIRRVGDMSGTEELSVEDDGTIELAREHLEWGTYGRGKYAEPHSVKLKDMSDAHIEAILLDGYRLHPLYAKYFPLELQYRKDNNIVVED